VRNALATTNLKAMRIGDLAFFYHSNEGKEIVGVVKVTREFYLDPKDETGKFGMVDVTAVEPLRKPVTLARAKADPALASMALVKFSRLSVQPVTPDEWKRVAHLGGIETA
jgi:predicted RNA-binding protein with PUA-like domain